MKSVNVLGTRVDCLTRAEVQQALMKVLKENKSSFVLSANTEMITAAYKNDDLRSLLNKADISFPDAIGVVKAGQKYGADITERVAGIDIAEWLLNLNNAPCYILGTRDDVLEKINSNNVIGKHNGFFSEAEEKGIILDINQKKPKVLLVALGMGRQEAWIVQHRHEFNVPIMLGVGGAIDVLAGTKKRAPKLFRDFHLEWFFRLFQEPKRIFRQLNLIKFLWYVFWDSKKYKRGR